MRQRIAHHKQQRGVGWIEHECPLNLPELICEFSSQDIVLVDCLTLWLNNWIFELGDDCCNERLEEQIELLVNAAAQSDATLILSLTKSAWVLCRSAPSVVTLLITRDG